MIPSTPVLSNVTVVVDSSMMFFIFMVIFLGVNRPVSHHEETLGSDPYVREAV